jgi:hypothetical protein
MGEHFSAARAIVDYRSDLERALPDLRVLRECLHQATGGPRDFVSQQWLQLSSVVVAFKPDLIIELGRGYGNSTCAFALATKMLSPQPCRTLSLCLADSFATVSRPFIEANYPDRALFSQLDARTGDIRAFDFTAHVAAAKRVFVFWDAHGYGLAQVILAKLFRLLEHKPHLAVVHDMADLKYMDPALRRYEAKPDWERLGSAPPKFILGDVGSQFEEGIALVDFLGRNSIPFRSAESSYFEELGADENANLIATFGDDFSRLGFWYSFSLNEADGRTLSFPELPIDVPETAPATAAASTEESPVPSRRPFLSWLTSGRRS